MSDEAGRFLRKHPDITTIEALLPDCNGIMRGKWLPRHKLAAVFRGELKLPLTALSVDLWGRDVPELLYESGDADGICMPVAGTLRPAAWAEGLGQVLVSQHDASGAPYPGDPRHVLRRVLDGFDEAGWRPVVAAELEFSLVPTGRGGAGQGSAERDFSAGRDGGAGAASGAGIPAANDTYRIDALHHYAPFLEGIRRACEAQQLPCDGIVKESAPAQYEINLSHTDDPILAADQVLMMRRLIKGVAARHGLAASFMAKPFEDAAGNSMHIHCSVLDKKGRNVFDDGKALPDGGGDSGAGSGSGFGSGGSGGGSLGGEDVANGGPSIGDGASGGAVANGFDAAANGFGVAAPLAWAIEGCLSRMAESTLIFAPNCNGLRRFAPGALAPVSPEWGIDNRTVAVRVPAGKPESRRLEHRVAGSDANPHLALAAILAAVREGMEYREAPPAPIIGDGYRQTDERYRFPDRMLDAIARFEYSSFIRYRLGEEFQRIFALGKRQEEAEFRRRIPPFERETFFERF